MHQHCYLPFRDGSSMTLADWLGSLPWGWPWPSTATWVGWCCCLSGGAGMSSPRSNKAPVATVVGAAAGTAAAAAVLVRMVSKNTLDLQANMAPWGKSFEKLYQGQLYYSGQKWAFSWLTRWAHFFKRSFFSQALKSCFLRTFFFTKCHFKTDQDIRMKLTANGHLKPFRDIQTKIVMASYCPRMLTFF